MQSSDATPRRPRLLLLAYACSPNHGSEAAVGWNRALQAARYCDTWVLCDDRDYGENLSEVLQQHKVPGLNFEILPMSRWQLSIAKVHALYWSAYHLWHRSALKKARELHQQHHFDLVHQVNYCAFREPGYLWKIDLPFVWGPVGGSQNFPLRFWREAGWRGAMLEAARTVINKLHLRWRRRVRNAVDRSAALLAANQTNGDDLRRVLRATPEIQVEVGVSKLFPQPSEDIDSNRPLRLLWVGQCLRFKGLGMLLKALAQLPKSTPFQLRVIGDGPLRKRWQRQAEDLGIADHVEWLLWRPHAEVLESYRWADAFVFTSLRDTTGTVLLESLAAAVPVICLDHQGARDVINSACGRKIPVTSPRQVVAELRDVVQDLSSNRQQLRRLSEGAYERAQQLSWARQGERMAAVYQRVLREAGSPAQIDLPAKNTKSSSQSVDGRAALPAVATSSPCFDEATP